MKSLIKFPFFIKFIPFQNVCKFLITYGSLDELYWTVFIEAMTISKDKVFNLRASHCYWNDSIQGKEKIFSPLQLDWEVTLNFCGLLGKHELYTSSCWSLERIVPLATVILRTLRENPNCIVRFLCYSFFFYVSNHVSTKYGAM